MLLHRFPIQVTPDAPQEGATQSMTILVSLYRRSVDQSYRRLICQQIEEGKMDAYISMMITNLVSTGKTPDIFIFTNRLDKI